MNYGRRRTIVAARTALERAVSVSEEKKNEEIKVPLQEEKAPVLGRGLCPKCKVKPNHYFHVKNCKA
jgi:hypothetical protein